MTRQIGLAVRLTAEDGAFDDLINHFATAFLMAELKADEEAAATLVPDAVDLPGIEFESEGYGTAAESGRYPFPVRAQTYGELGDEQQVSSVNS